MARFRFYALKLCAFIFLIFLLQIFFPNFTELFVLNKNALAEWWRFVSALFLHAGLAHLIYNLFALALFGSILESLIDGRRFLIVYFFSGIFANIISIFFYPSALGASGAIFGIIGTLIVIRPGLLIWAFGLPMPIFVAGVLWGLGDFIGAIGYLSGNPINNTGNIAHLTGMFIGFYFGFLWRKRYERRIAMRKSRLALDERSMRRWEDGYLR